MMILKKIKEVVLKVENDLKEELKESDEHVFVRLEKSRFF